jgi:hypothetical protein
MWTATSSRAEDASYHSETLQFGMHDSDEVISMVQGDTDERHTTNSKGERVDGTRCILKTKQQPHTGIIGSVEREMKNKLSTLNDLLKDSIDEDLGWEKQALVKYLDYA